MPRKLAKLGIFSAIGLLGLPVALLIPSAMLDRGPSGKLRASLFPIALAVFDPYVWTCVGNSLIVATIITVGSLCLGLALARIEAPWRYWGRRPLAGLAWMPLAIPPAFAAVGLMQLISPLKVGQGLAKLSGRALCLGLGWDVWISWGLLIWVGLATATPIMALSIKAALGRIAPSWADAGRALGATHRQTWRHLVWPIIRPEIARTLAAVFAIALLEPGAPIVLGLRRTLAYQMVDAVLQAAPATRVATLALIGLITAILGRFVVRWWGGSRVTIDQLERVNRPWRANGWRASLFILGWLAWIGFGLAPLIGFGGTNVGAFDLPAEGRWLTGLASLVYALLDPDITHLWINSLGLALAVTLIDASLITLIARVAPARRVRADRPSLTILAFERTPALVLGMAASLVPGLLNLVANHFGLSPLDQLAHILNPIRWPGLLLIATCVALRLPTLARAADRAELRARPALANAALSLGDTHRRAIRLGGGRGPGLGVLILTFTLTATAVAPVIVLAPTIRTRTIGPGLMILVDDRSKAAGLTVGAIALNVIGLFAARKGRSGPPGDWFRG